MVHRAGVVLVEDKGQGAGLAEATIGETDSVRLDELGRRGLVIVLDHRNSPWRVGFMPTCQAIEAGGVPRSENCEQAPRKGRPFPGAEVSSAPGRDHLVALTAIDVEDVAGDE